MTPSADAKKPGAFPRARLPQRASNLVAAFAVRHKNGDAAILLCNMERRPGGGSLAFCRETENSGGDKIRVLN